MSRIPKILHFCFGLAQDFGGKEWSLIHHASVASAVDRLSPDQVFFYYEYEPTGPWWPLTKRLVTPVQVKAPREIFGRPLAHPAHRADVLRLEKLIEHGGIYLDADVLVHRDFDDLLDNSAVLGQEGFGSDAGMCNAIILAEPNAPFLKRWHAEYKWFRGNGGENWGEHSVIVPARLAAEHPDEITKLPPTAFFWPLWSPEHIDWLFDSTDPIPDTGAYANHLWESQAWHHLEFLTPGEVRARNTNFHRWVRPYLEGLPDDHGSPSLGQRLHAGARRGRRWLGAKVHDFGETVRDRPVGQRARNLARRGNRLLRAGLSGLGDMLKGPDAADSQQSRREVFERVYADQLWGSEGESRFYSGFGSRGIAAEEYVRNMTEILMRHQAELGRQLTVVDVGCGDFMVGQALVDALPGLRYIGCDIVPALVDHHNQLYGSNCVSFRCLDVVADRVPVGDVCLVRQVFQHLSNSDIAQALLNIEGFAAVYVSEAQPQVRIGPPNPDKHVGADIRFDWRRGIGRGVELAEPPFGQAVEEMFGVSSGHEMIVTSKLLPDVQAQPEMIVAMPMRT